MLRATALLLFTSLLAACGQRGALYIPEADSTAVVVPASTPPADANAAAPAAAEDPEAAARRREQEATAPTPARN